MNSTAYSCMSSCGVLISGTICCPSSAPLVLSVGSQACINTCPAAIYYLNGTINQCNATCAMPFGIQTSSLGSPAAYLCSACSSPKFIQRSNSSCVSSCSYVNSTTVNSTAITVCETAGNATFCPYYTYLNASAFTCISTCGSLLTGQTCCTASMPLVPSAGSIVCQNSCSSNIYF